MKSKSSILFFVISFMCFATVTQNTFAQADLSAIGNEFVSAENGSTAKEPVSGKNMDSDASILRDEAAVMVKFISTIQKPKTHHDMLENMQRVVSAGLLLNDALYTSENLEKLFGGEKKDWAWVDATEWVTGKNFLSHLPKPSCSECRVLPSQYRFDNAIKADWRGTGFVGEVRFDMARVQGAKPGLAKDVYSLSILMPRNEEITYEEAVKMFLEDWEHPQISSSGTLAEIQAGLHVDATQRIAIPRKKLGDSSTAGQLVFTNKGLSFAYFIQERKK